MVHTRLLPAILPLLLLSTLLAATAAAIPAPETWDNSFGAPGVNGDVYSVVEYGGDLVIGGEFLSVGGVAATNIARWDGVAWSPMGDVFDGAVRDLIVWNGDLYAGGWFTDGLMQWDGLDWSAVDGGLDGSVEDMTIWNGNLAVGGYFSSAGGGSAFPNSIVVWDGSFWDELDGGIFGDVFGVASYGGSLYACGTFDDAGGIYVQNLARWDGAAWHDVGGGLSDASFDPYAAYGNGLAVHGGQLVVGGYFERAGSLSIGNLVAWNGFSFGPVGSQPAFDEVYAVGTAGLDLIAGDATGAVHRWDGLNWSLPGYAIGYPAAVGEYGGDLVVGGGFVSIGGAPATSLARFDGSWWPMATGMGATGIVESLHEWNGMPVAGGRFPAIGGTAGVVAAWNGSAWTPLGSGIPYAFGVTVASLTTFEGDLIAGGTFSTAGGVPANKIARFDGTNWSAMGAGSLATVSGLLALDGELYANGYWSGQQTLGHWNGTDFDPLGTSVLGGVQILYSLGSFQGDPVMGGHFTSVDGVAAANVARWDGAVWNPLGAGTNGSVHAIHEMGGVLYVGGGFSQAGGVSATNIAAWDGTTWSALGGGLSGGRVFGLASIGSDLYATGEFTQADGQPCAYVARWDGSAWHTLDSGFDAEGRTLLASGGQLWAGGEFQLAGAAGSLRVGRWQPSVASAAPLVRGDTRIAMRPAWPNPFTSATALAFDLPAPANVVIDVYDLRGARIRTFARNGLAAGPHRVSWDGRDAAGHEAPSGVYFVALRDGVSTARQRVVLLR
ncbi:T9SS type A sorting domain-containing protein [bacterium]|nr:T9SS type A sorting domain-containing protein [bacterium]